MRLTHKTLKEAFLESGFSDSQLSTARLIMYYAEDDDGIELRYALSCVRKYRYEVSVFVESTERVKLFETVLVKSLVI
jgi:hypothetical protein